MNAFTGTNALHSTERSRPDRRLQFRTSLACRSAMSTRIEELADRVERLLLRHEELQRTNALLA